MTQHEAVLRGNEQQKVSSAGFIVGPIQIIIGTMWVTMLGLGDPMEALSKFSETVILMAATLIRFSVDG